MPPDPLNLDQLHGEDMKGRTLRYWPQYHAAWTTMWNDHYDNLIEGFYFSGNGHLCDTTMYV